ncbi:TIR domain-containing protein [Herbidospora daliensis]|uniref:WD40 domain-containing protein n=1 Tax=Herbidospora daliensis TaxID=295585 RepID=UPI000780F416|nr:TIR domain-containing protein [Herbidospora daliensis]
MERPIDIFISYSPADERWASWLGWELEAAGYRTMLQAWDFVPGTNFVDFMDRGVREAAVVLALLTENYLGSRYGKLEWQAALRANPDNPENKLITVRIEDCRVDGLLSNITWVDLVGVTTPEHARGLVLTRIREALAGRAKPELRPAFPTPGSEVQPPAPLTSPRPTVLTGQRRARRVPVVPPGYPADFEPPARRDSLSVLHVAGPRFGRTMGAEPPLSPAGLQSHIFAELTRLTDAGVPRPELMVVAGDLTAAGSRKQMTDALTFLTGLRALAGLEPQRVVLVPGARDVNLAACEAYFNDCKADDERPEAPYWPKWRHFASLFREFYQGVDSVMFDSAQPWTLFAIPEIKVVVAGLNSTMAISHRTEHRFGLVGESQAAWFAERVRAFEREGWLRLGVVHHGLTPGHPDSLTDAAVVEGLLGGKLHTILQGGGRDGGRSELGSGALVLPPLEPGRQQVLEFTPEGLVVHRTSAPPDAVERRWISAGGIFPAPGAVPVPLAVGGPEPDRAAPARAQGPKAQLLDRVAEACETRFDHAVIRTVDDDPPHLRVSYRDGGFVREFWVGVIVGEPTAEEVDEFVRHVHAGHMGQSAELVYLGPVPPRSLREDAARRGVRLRSLIEFQGLVDLSGYVAAQTRQLNADTTYPAHLYVTQDYRELDPTGGEIRHDLAGELISQLHGDQGRFVLVLGDFGRGKTFVLRQVVRRMATETPHLTPILIDLRTLDKAHSVETLIAAHLANHGEDQIDLKAVQYMLRQGRIVLFFDGFDELVTRVTYDRAADHLETLLQAAQDQAKIVVASRTQHFKSDAQVFTKLGEMVGILPQRRVFSIEGFSSEQILAYLINAYGDRALAEERLRLLRSIQDLSGLARNPRMLTFIADLADDRLRAVAHAHRTVSAATLYQEILGSWLRYEQRRLGNQRGAQAGLDEADLWHAVRTLAMRLWETNEPYLRLAELAEVAETLSGLADGRMSGEQATHTVGTASLLVRTYDGLFGFIHGSVAEWLVAHYIADEFGRDRANPTALSRRELSQLTVDFLCDLAEAHDCQLWADRVLADPGAGNTARKNALKIITRLRTPAQTSLRGAQLRGEDLSHRDLQEVDLTDADLTDARLVGTNLSRAILRGTKLAGAWLDEARLTGADLRGADLTRARLARTDLRDAVVSGSRWTRATLVNVTAGDRVLRAPELRDAAVVPGCSIEVQVAPPAVGVPYGFDPLTTRLPNPIAYNTDGQIFAVGCDNGGVMVFEAPSGRPIRTLWGHRDRAYALAFGAQDLLATGSADGDVRIWDTATGECAHVLPVHPKGVWPLLFNEGGTLLAAGSPDGTLMVWETATGALRCELPGHTPPVYTAVFGPDGTSLITGDASANVRVWDLTTGELRVVLSEGTGPVYRLALSPDGSLLAAGDHYGLIRLFETASGRVVHELRGHPGRVYAVDFHPEGTHLATGDTMGTIRVWNLRAPLVPRQLAGHTGAVYQVSYTPDGKNLISVDSNGSLRMWQGELGQPRAGLAGHRGSIWPFAIHPGGAQLATTSNDDSIRLWDLGTGQLTRTLRGHGRRVTSVNFSPDGTMLASSGNDGAVRIWEPPTGRLIKEFSGVNDQLTSAVFSPDGERIATTTNDGAVHLRQTAGWDFERELDTNTESIWAQAFSPDGKILATANDDDTLQLWYRTSNTHVAKPAPHQGRVRSIDFSPDGRLVATGCDDRLVRVWDAATGECLRIMSGHTDRVYRVVFNPMGTALASIGNDGVARIWDHTTGRELQALGTGTGRLWTGDFSTDGSILATAGDDRLIRLWDVATGRHLHTLAGHSRRVVSVAFSPAEPLLASAGNDGLIILWDLSGPEPARKVSLLGVPGGWAAFAPDGRYKQEGNVHGEFWFAIAMCRFDPGELDPYLDDVRLMVQQEEF